jgi:acyl-CoA hydrolase
MLKPCPICSVKFVCDPVNILNCACYTVPLEKADLIKPLDDIKECICSSCLKTLASSPALTHPNKNQKKRMTLEEKIEKATTRTFKAVLPNTTNHYNTLFGGTALQMMDEVAFICATRFSRKRMVTISSEKVHFKQAIPAGTLIELVAKVERVGSTSLEIKVDIFLEEMYAPNRQKAISGKFTFVAIDINRNPMKVLDIPE